VYLLFGRHNGNLELVTLVGSKRDGVILVVSKLEGSIPIASQTRIQERAIFVPTTEDTTANGDANNTWNNVSICPLATEEMTVSELAVKFATPAPAITALSTEDTVAIVEPVKGAVPEPTKVAAATDARTDTTLLVKGEVPVPDILACATLETTLVAVPVREAVPLPDMAEF